MNPPERIAHYLVETEIDRGGMGVVYRGRDTRLDRLVAIKALPRELASDRRKLARLEREARLLALVSHPNIATIYAIEEVDGLPYLILEYVAGESLAERLTRGPLDPRAALDIGAQVAAALEAAHERGVIHRDLKPANVRVTPEGVVKVLDFGLAKALAETDEDTLPLLGGELTPIGIVVGTAGYVSPELIRREPCDRRADIWSLGCLLFECLTGRRTWQGTTRGERIVQSLTAEPDWQLLPAATPLEVRDLLRRCLEKDPGNRLARVREARLALESALDQDGTGAARPVLPGNLPTPITSFVGREREKAELRLRLAETRLLTLAGPGGCGKTRLAIEICREIAAEFPHGAWLVDLSPLSDPALVPQAVAAALGIAEETGRSAVESLALALRERHLLLVLDSCENVLEVAATLAGAILPSCPDVRVIATSREPLGITGERVYTVTPFTAPDPARLPPLDRLRANDAVRLFVERATAVSPIFGLTAANAAAVAQICHRLDGVPLALELAAARVRALPVEGIAERLDNRFQLLTGGSRTAPPRHQTLRALIDWSHEALSEEEKALLRRLAIFSGRFSLEATEGVCAGGGVAEDAVLDLLSRLLDRSLVMVEARGGALRYRLLDTVRAYGRERLEESGEHDAVAARHLGFFLALAESPARDLAAAEWLEQLDEVRDDLRTALAWSAGSPGRGESGLRLGAALVRFFLNRGYFREGRTQLEAVLRANPEARGPAAVAARDTLGRIAFFQGDYATARACHEEALGHARAIGDDAGTARALAGLASLAHNSGDFERCRTLAGESLRMHRQNGDAFGTSACLNTLAAIAWRRGELGDSAALLEEALAIHRRSRDPIGIARCLANLAILALYRRDYAACRSAIDEALRLNREMRNHLHVANGLATIALLELRLGDLAACRAAAAASLTISTDLGYRRGIAIATDLTGEIDLQEGDLIAARRRMAEGLAILAELDDVVTIGDSLEGFARLETAAGNPERAVPLFAAAHELSERAEARVVSLMHEEHETSVAAARAALGEAEFDRLWAEGAKLPVAAAVAAATGTVTPATRREDGE
jgi:non-specific serine/threonine protein kinase